MAESSYILYIEDENSTIDLVDETLKTFGLKMVGITSGVAGLAAMRAHKPALLLLDLLIPDQSGPEIYREMKLDPDLADIPVIVVSGKNPDYARTIIADLPPAHDYIVKPFDPDQLIRSIRHVIYNHHSAK
jgi:CheY-like chemotaxis protein